MTSISKAQVLALLPELRRQGLPTHEVRKNAEKIAEQLDRYSERDDAKPHVAPAQARAMAILTRHLVSPEKALALGLKAIADVFAAWPTQWSATGAQIHDAWVKGFSKKCDDPSTSAKAADDMMKLLSIEPQMKLDREQLDHLFNGDNVDEVMNILGTLGGSCGSDDALEIIAEELGMRPALEDVATVWRRPWTYHLDVPVSDAFGDWQVPLAMLRGPLVERARLADESVDADAMVDELFAILGISEAMYVKADDILAATGSKRGEVQQLLERYGFALKPGDEVRNGGLRHGAPCLLPETWLSSDHLQTPITQNWAAALYANGEHPQAADGSWVYSAKSVQMTLAQIFLQNKDDFHDAPALTELDALAAASEVLSAMGVTALDWNDEVTAQHIRNLTTGKTRDAVAAVMKKRATATALKPDWDTPLYPMTPEMLALLLAGKPRIGYAYADLQIPLVETRRTQREMQGDWAFNRDNPRVSPLEQAAKTGVRVAIEGIRKIGERVAAWSGASQTDRTH